jgi:hypothetical protein
MSHPRVAERRSYMRSTIVIEYETAQGVEAHIVTVEGKVEVGAEEVEYERPAMQAQVD